MNRLDSLEKRFNTLYNRMYARHIRRDREKYAAHENLYSQYQKAVSKIKTIDKLGNVLGAIQREINKGRVFFTVTQQEYAALRALLKRKRQKRTFTL